MNIRKQLRIYACEKYTLKLYVQFVLNIFKSNVHNSLITETQQAISIRSTCASRSDTPILL